MLYTTYYANLRRIDKDNQLVRVGISRQTPFPLDYKYQSLAPTNTLLKEYKAGLSEAEYVERYTEQLNTTFDIQDFMYYIECVKEENPNKEIAILCYEKGFCHRNIASKYLRDSGIFCIEYGVDAYDPSLDKPGFPLDGLKDFFSTMEAHEMKDLSLKVPTWKNKPIQEYTNEELLENWYAIRSQNLVLGNRNKSSYSGYAISLIQELLKRLSATSSQYRFSLYGIVAGEFPSSLDVADFSPEQLIEFWFVFRYKLTKNLLPYSVQDNALLTFNKIQNELLKRLNSIE